MTVERAPMPSPNYSGRGGSGVRLIVLHTAEGATTIESLGNFFANDGNDVSSHAGADDKPGVIGVYVRRGDKAWTAADANPYAVQIELCGFAAWTAAEWDAHPNMLANTAAWIAEEAAAFGIPLVRLSSAEAQGGAAGVCQHVDLGASGGGHWDCGPDFPMDRVLDMARGGAPAAPVPQRKKDDDMPYYLFAPSEGGDGRWWITNLRTDSRPCDSLDDALNVDYFLRGGPPTGAGVDGLVCNRKDDGSVAGPIAVDTDWLRTVTAHAAAAP